MSDSNRLKLSTMLETSFGVAPTGGYISAITISASDTDNSFNDTGNGFVSGGFVAGSRIYVTGFTDASNNGFFIADTVAVGKIVVRDRYVVTESAGDAVVITYGRMKELPLTGETLAQTTESAVSAIIRDDRQTSNVVRTNIGAAGTVNYEMVYDALHDELRSALYSDGWSQQVSETAATFSMAAGDNSINDSGSGFVTAGFAAHQWIKTSGFATAANNGYWKIVSVAVGKMVLAGGTVATESAPGAATIKMGPQIVNGTTMDTYTIEKKFSDLTSEYELLYGMTVDQLSLDVSPGAIVNGTLTYLGKNADSAAATIGTAYETAPSYAPMNAVDNVEAVLEGGSSFATLGFTMALANNARGRPQVGTLGSISIGTGKLNVSGTLRAYFTDSTIFDKYIDSDESSLAVIFEDQTGNAYVIDLPRIRYTTGSRNATTENTDVVADLAWQAFRHGTETVTVRIAKFTA